MYIRGWDDTITLSSGAGQTIIIDEFNGLELLQIITSPSNENAIYNIEILNTDFNLLVFERAVQGKFNEIINFPCYGHNTFRIRNANPATGTVIVALRFRVP